MESEVRNYRLERCIAWILALMFFLPFVARADDAPRALIASRSDVAPVRLSIDGTDATLAWQCKSTGIDDFEQCALMLDAQVLTWRMAPRGEDLSARVRFAGDLDGDRRQDVMIDISRNGRSWQSHVFQRTRANR